MSLACMVRKLHIAPHLQLLSCGGDLAIMCMQEGFPWWQTTVKMDGQVLGEGGGASKRDADRQAAQAALMQAGFEHSSLTLCGIS